MIAFEVLIMTKTSYVEISENILEEFGSGIKMESGFFILNDRRINLLSLCKFNVSKMQNCSYNPKNCLLKWIIYYQNFDAIRSTSTLKNTEN